MAALICEVVYRGIFQKNLAARITRGIVLSARKSGRWGIAFGRYGDSPQRNGIPAKDFAIVADTKEELEQNMARYEPKHVDVTICVDDTLSKGVESWAWYGLQPINRLTVPNGTLLMTSLQSLRRAAEGHPQEGRAVHAGAHPRQGLLLGAVGLQGGSHRGADPRARWPRSPRRSSRWTPCARPSRRWSGAPTSRSPPPARPTSAWRRARSRSTEGNAEIPYSFEMPKWWEMREGVTIPAIPIGKPKEGGKGYVPERNPYFKKYTTRTMRPVIDFDTCVKCNLCWISCPDSVLRRDARRDLRRQHGGVLRLRRVRGGVPGGELHHHGQRVGLLRTTPASGRCGARTRPPTRPGCSRRSATRRRPSAPTASASAASTRKS